MKSVKIDFGGESKAFPLGVSILLYGSVASGKTTFSLTLAREFLKNSLPCIWICLDENPASVREKMEYFQIDYKHNQDQNLLRFIDLYSEQITGKSMNDPYIINCSSAFNLNEINRALMRALSEVKGQGIVVFDSVSSLLLYNRSGTAEEFLKVHMARITSAGFTGFFILQRDLHAPQTEETLKMMCDSVLEFGFDKDVRKIGIVKIPLGSSGEWIASNLFAWQQPEGISASTPAGPRKYMDSGGYLEEIKDGLVEGLKEGLSHMGSHTEGGAPSQGRGGNAPAAPAEGYNAGQMRPDERAQPRTTQQTGTQTATGEYGIQQIQTGGLGGATGGINSQYAPKEQAKMANQGQSSPGSQPNQMGQQQYNQYGTEIINRGREQQQGPTVQHIDKQIIVTELGGLPDKLGDDLKKLLTEQLHLRESIHEKDEQTRESKKRLNLLEDKEVQAVREVRVIEEKNDTLRKEISTKRVALAELEAQKAKEEANYADSIKRLQAVKSKTDAINSRKKNLESKIHDLVEDSGEMYIDLAPILQDALAKRQVEVAKAKEVLDKFDINMSSMRSDIRLLEDELTEVARKNEDKRHELDDVRDRKVKAESELTMVSSAKDETESKLKEIVDKKKQMEAKLKELMERSD